MQKDISLEGILTSPMQEMQLVKKICLSSIQRGLRDPVTSLSGGLIIRTQKLTLIKRLMPMSIFLQVHMTKGTLP